MTVAELIAKLQQYPLDAEVGCRDVSVNDKGVDHNKLILVVSGHELDPVFQFTGPFQCGYGPEGQKKKFHRVAHETIFAEAVRQLADKIAVEDDQSWRATLRNRFADWMRDCGEPAPIADEIDENCVAMTEAHLRVYGRAHATPQG